MPKFSYTAINKAGKSITGSIDAVSRDSVADSLVKQGLRPVTIKTGGEKASISKRFASFGSK